MSHLLEKLRRISFWTVDFVTGNKINMHYRDIKFILENYDTPLSRKKREQHLKNILKHATQTSKFYKGQKDFTSLGDFPIINKSIIREQITNIQSSAYKNKINHEMSTSGSSGTPFTTLQDDRKRNRNTADTIYFKKQAGFEVGHRLYYIRKWFEMHKKNWLSAWTQNIVMYDVTEFTDEYLAKFIKTLETDASTKTLIGYSSAFTEICKYLDGINSKPIDTDISCIVTMSESLSDYTRSSLEKYFNAPILNRYSNLENGILSMQFPNMGDYLQINWASYYIEILHPIKDEIVNPGELGRVVVTDLFNYCMPMIRYDTGDLAVMTKENPYFNHAPAFSKVEGRKMDVIYDTKGKPQSSFIVFHMESYPQLKQFQFIQESEKNYLLNLNVEGIFEPEQELVSLFKSYLGSDAQINVNYVNKIPQLSSGKRRLTINNYIKPAKKTI